MSVSGCARLHHADLANMLAISVLQVGARARFDGQVRDGCAIGYLLDVDEWLNASTMRGYLGATYSTRAGRGVASSAAILEAKE